MIGHIEGVVYAVRAGFAVLSVGGIGYKVAATREVLATLAEGKAAALWTHLAVRETAHDLYGFKTEEELRFFELLLTVSGIGPKSALAVLDIASVETLRSAVAGGNASYLTKAGGSARCGAESVSGYRDGERAPAGSPQDTRRQTLRGAERSNIFYGSQCQKICRGRSA
ncbi:MAG: Holliday junction ATP-dependent DNA helicase RuvA [Parcubacteria group bacterium GW2011_GWA2_56_21]|nr:MAG: Holliday junction ATP-dependent DNA helicase RuvA [Parcubacteria group bacterium GW2011_GWA2_56_21]